MSASLLPLSSENNLYNTGRVHIWVFSVKDEGYSWPGLGLLRRECVVIPSNAVVDLSRIQFALTAIYHFLFAPLTLGLSWILVMMEACYLKTGKVIFRDMTKFWGKLFAINFAMGVVTGITMEFEFGLNWAYFSRYIGDAFGTALAIEGITAFMLEATMIGVFFFAWDKIGKKTHWFATLLLAVGSNLSILNILVANSWMQHPAHTFFNWQTMHMHLTSLWGMYMLKTTQNLNQQNNAEILCKNDYALSF